MEATPVCPSCGKALEPNAPQGLCQKCLLEVGFPTGTETGGGSARFIPPPLEELSSKFPQLELLEFIGQGGMGAVYKARQKQLDRIVALKILPPRDAAGLGFAERFTREARALAKLNHPHIVTLYEFGQADGLFYFLMEFVDGLNLRQVLKSSRLAPNEALAIVPQICDALQFAHERGIVHRDIKPENILLSREGWVKIADFGVAKIVGQELAEAAAEKPTASTELTQTGSALGTPQYMAPEQFKNSADVDHRADIYSLGVVFYQMLTGELPSRQLESPSRKVAIDVRLDEVVLRALEKEPALRYQRVSEVKERVETIAHAPKAKPSRPIHPLVKYVAVLVSVILLVAIGFYLRGPHLAAPQPTPLLQIDAITSLPTNNLATNSVVGIPATPPVVPPRVTSDQGSNQAVQEINQLISAGLYDEALQRCLAFHARYKTSGALIPLLNDWIELGRRYPKAKTALIEIRDRDVREFAEGRGYFDLFSEVNSINSYLREDESTYALFKSFRDRDLQLAQQCYPFAEGLLIAHGEHQWCYDHMGDPQNKFNSIHQILTLRLEQNKNYATMAEASKKRMAEFYQRRGMTNVPAFSPPDTSAMMKKSAEDNFVSQTRQLIEILVATGHIPVAEKIRDQAVTILDDARLKSAVADAQERIKTTHTN